MIIKTVCEIAHPNETLFSTQSNQIYKMSLENILLKRCDYDYTEDCIFVNSSDYFIILIQNARGDGPHLQGHGESSRSLH